MPVHEGDFFTTLNQVRKLMEELPLLAGAEAERFFIRNFRLEGFQGDTGLEPWPERNPNFGGTHKVLQGPTGKLRQGIQKEVTGTRIKVQVVGAAEKYADTQNFGARIAVTAAMKGHFWKMYYQTKDDRWRGMALKKIGSIIVIPARKFIGESKQLDERLQNLLEKQIKKITL